MTTTISITGAGPIRELCQHSDGSHAFTMGNFSTTLLLNFADLESLAKSAAEFLRYLPPHLRSAVYRDAIRRAADSPEAIEAAIAGVTRDVLASDPPIVRIGQGDYVRDWPDTTADMDVADKNGRK